jgi:hypothetical protein
VALALQVSKPAPANVLRLADADNPAGLYDGIGWGVTLQVRGFEPVKHSYVLLMGLFR